MSHLSNFLPVLPTTWGETRDLSAYAGVRIVLARRSGDVWYVAGKTGEEARDVELPDLVCKVCKVCKACKVCKVCKVESWWEGGSGASCPVRAGF